jgi:hypothetical protein
MRGLRIIVTGLIAQHPRLGGVTWDYLQYLLGLERLGHSVTYVEDSGQWPYRLEGDGKAHSAEPNAAHLEAVLSRYGFRGRWAYRCAMDGACYGLSMDELRTLIRETDLLINVSGSMIDPEPYTLIPVRAYIDSDPAFTQIRAATDPWFLNLLRSFNVHFTFGETLHNSGLPDAGLLWLPTRSPILPELWETTGRPRPVLTTVMSWASYRPLSFAGRRFSQKDAEFQKFLTLPQLVPAAALEVAFHPVRNQRWEDAPLPRQSLESLLQKHGWVCRNSLEAAGDPESYRDYLTGSMAEWSVAKGGYVTGRTGWFSCRSACYLAAGRPVAVQDTGFSQVIPCGEGILPFHDLASAAAAIDNLLARYDRHAKAAAALAREYFDAGKVLSSLLERALDPPSPPRKEQTWTACES